MIRAGWNDNVDKRLNDIGICLGRLEVRIVALESKQDPKHYNDTDNPLHWPSGIPVKSSETSES